MEAECGPACDWTRTWRRALTESTTTHGRYLRYLLEHLAVTDEAEIEAIARWRRGYNLPVGLWNRADPEALEAVRRVRAAGLVAGVISNSNGSVRAILEETGLAAHLDFIIDSSVVGVEKPDPRIFELGLREAGVGAAHAVYVGDLYSVDVLGARGAGLDGILLDPGGFWGPRDCRLARGLGEAVRLALAGPSPPGPLTGPLTTGPSPPGPSPPALPGPLVREGYFGRVTSGGVT